MLNLLVELVVKKGRLNSDEHYEISDLIANIFHCRRLVVEKGLLLFTYITRHSDLRDIDHYIKFSEYIVFVLDREDDQLIGKAINCITWIGDKYS